MNLNLYVKRKLEIHIHDTFMPNIYEGNKFSVAHVSFTSVNIA